jgi:hypothetical protein
MTGAFLDQVVQRFVGVDQKPFSLIEGGFAVSIDCRTRALDNVFVGFPVLVAEIRGRFFIKFLAQGGDFLFPVSRSSAFSTWSASADAPS